jgi:hypothetical protein
MVESSSENYITANSELRILNGPPFLTEFYADLYKIRVTSVSNYSYADLTGEGYIVINGNQDQAFVTFNNVSLTNIAGSWYLNEGTVQGAFPSNYQLISINTGNSGKQITFHPDSVRATKNEGIQSKGHFEWVISDITEKNDTISSNNEWTDYSYYYVTSITDINKTKTIKKLQGLPIDYQLKILDNSYFKILKNIDHSLFFGEINDGTQSVSLPFEISQNDSLQHLELSSNGNISILQDDSLAIAFNIKSGVVDFTADTSLNNINTWKGIQFDSIETVFSRDLDFHSPSFTFIKKHIDTLGIQIQLSNNNILPCKFKGYPSTIDSLNLNVKNSLLDSTNLISGTIDVPYISNDNLFNYNFEITQNNVSETINNLPNDFEFDAFNAKFKTFSISPDNNLIYGEIDHINNTIKLLVDTTTNLNPISNYFTVSGVTVVNIVNNTNQIRGETLNDYSLTSSNSFKVYSSDSSITKIYSVTISSLTSVINQNTIKPIKVFPNPIIDNVTINIYETYNQLDIRIFNSLGQLKLQSNKEKIKMSHLESGLYYIYINIDTEKTIIQKVKKR